MEKEIVHIVINDWTMQFKTPACQKLIEDLTSLENNVVFPFNFAYTVIEYAQFFFITTTEEDLAKYGLSELMTLSIDDELLHKRDSIYTINMFPEYDPEKWSVKNINNSFDYDSLCKDLYVFVDDNGDEFMSNTPPTRIEEYVAVAEKYNKPNKDDVLSALEIYQQNRYHRAQGWMHYFQDDDFKLYDIIQLPTGFIEQNLGHNIDNKTVESLIEKLYDPLKVKLLK